MDFRSGVRLGRYVLRRRIGRGGMAEVWEAQDETLQRTVAIKVVLESYAEEPEFRTRFLREARLVAGLEHPNVLKVYDFGEHDRVIFLVMPYLPGDGLNDRLTQAVPRPLALGWLRDLASALDYGHQRGVVHRDVKPANVLFDEHGHLFLCDFGIAKSLNSATLLTVKHAALGTPVYMSPEQASAEAVDARSDQYSLAVLAFRLLTGHLPIENVSTPVALHKTIYETLPLPSLVSPDLPRVIDAVFERAFAKKATGRFSSCSEFVRALAKALGMEPIASNADPTRDSTIPPGISFSAMGDDETTPVSGPPAWASSITTVADSQPIGETPPAGDLKKQSEAGRPLMVGLAFFVVVFFLVGAWLIRRPTSLSQTPKQANTTPAATTAATENVPTPTSRDVPLRPSPVPDVLVQKHPPQTASNTPLQIPAGTQSRIRKVLFTGGHGERAFQARTRDSFSTLAESLRRDSCTVEEWQSLGAFDVPPATDLVVVAGPKTAFTSREAAALKRYLVAGGRALFFLDAEFTPGDASSMANLGLKGLLSEYGVGLDDDVVLDPRSRLPMMGPETVVARTFRPHAVTRILEGAAVVFPLARSVSVEKPPASVTASILVETSADGWGETDIQSLESGMKNDDKDVKAPVPLAVAVETGGAEKDKDKVKKARFVVFGDADFASDGFVANSANLDLLTAAANWVLAGGLSGAIPPRSSSTGTR